MITLTSIAALALAVQAQPIATDETATQTATAEAAETTETMATTEAVENAEEAKNESRVVCKRRAIVGSKFKKRLCGTAKQWQALAQRGSDTAAEMRKKGKGGAIGN